MASKQPAHTGEGLIGAETRPLFGRLLSVRHDYATELDQQRAVALAVISLVFGALGLWGVIGLELLVPDAMPQTLFWPNVAMSAVYLIIHALVQGGRLRIASIAFVVMTLVVPAVQAAYQAGWKPARRRRRAAAVGSAPRRARSGRT